MIIILDENYSHRLAEGLNLLEEGNKNTQEHCEVRHSIELGESLNMPKTGRSYTDEQVIEMAGRVQGIIFTQDKDFKKIKHYYSLYKHHKVGVVFCKTQLENRGYWNMVKTFINRWEDLKNIIAAEKPPFCFLVNSNGIQRHDF